MQALKNEPTEQKQLTRIHGGARTGMLAGLIATGLAWLAAPAASEPILLFQSMFDGMDLSGGVYSIPLASDPTNALGDSVQGYGFVDSEVTFSLSSQRTVNPGPATVGLTVATPRDLNPMGKPGEGNVNPSNLDGEAFFVDSFFDVFFDLSVEDVDARPGRDYAGQPDGASIVLSDIGPAQIFASYEAIFDKNAPGFGLLWPAAADPFLGLLGIEIPLGGDVNGNGEDDKIKIQLGTLSLSDQNRQFITFPDGTMISQFDIGGLVEAEVVDVSTDPPFSIGAISPTTGLPDPNDFGGPTTATSVLVNPVPEPSALGLMGALGALLPLARRSASR